MAIKIKLKKKKIKKKNYKYTIIDADFIHWISRLTFVQGLIRGGSKHLKMESQKIDNYCSFNSPKIRETIRVLVEFGFLNPDDLKVPEKEVIKAIDCKFEGKPEWIVGKEND